MEIYYFSTAWCQPCKTYKPLVERVLLDYPSLSLSVKVADQEDMELAAQYKVTRVPTLIAAKEGYPRLAQVATEDDLRAWLDPLTND